MNLDSNDVEKILASKARKYVSDSSSQHDNHFDTYSIEDSFYYEKKNLLFVIISRSYVHNNNESGYCMIVKFAQDSIDRVFYEKYYANNPEYKDQFNFFTKIISVNEKKKFKITVKTAKGSNRNLTVV